MPKVTVPKEDPATQSSAELEGRVRQLEAEIAERQQVIKQIKARIKAGSPKNLRPLNPAEQAAMDLVNQRAMETDPRELAQQPQPRYAPQPQPVQPPAYGGGGRLGRFPR